MSTLSKLITKLFVPLICLFVLFLLFMNRNIGIYDEGLILTGAEQIVNGQIIHRDFYANYGPGQFYIIAAIFKYFGHSVLNERIYDTIIKTIIIYVVYFFLRRYTSANRAFCCAGIVALYVSALATYAYPVYPCIALALILLIIIIDYNKDKQLWRIIAVSILTAAITLFRYDIGFFVYLSIISFFYLKKYYSVNSSKTESKAILKDIIIYSIYTGLPILALIITYHKNNILNDFLFDIVNFPAQSYAKTRGLPFPGVADIFTRKFIVDIAIYGPLFLILISSIHLYKTKLHNQPDNPRTSEIELSKAHAILILNCLSFFLYFKGVVRVSVMHTFISIVPSIMAAMILISSKSCNKYIVNFAKIILTIYFISATKLMIGSIWKEPLIFKAIISDQASHDNLSYPERYISRLGEFSGAPLFLVENNRQEAYIDIVKNLNPGEYFYSGLLNHDKVYINDISAYFILNLMPATKWYHFDPELQNSSKIQSDIIGELTLNKPKLLLLDDTWDSICEPNASCYRRNAHELDIYINENYEFRGKFSQIQIWSKR